VKYSYRYCLVVSNTHNDEILPFTEKEVVADEIADMSLNEKV